MNSAKAISKNNRIRLFYYKFVPEKKVGGWQYFVEKFSNL